MKEPKQVVAYARGQSIAAQLEMLRGYALDNGLQIVREFADVASATRNGKPRIDPVFAESQTRSTN